MNKEIIIIFEGEDREGNGSMQGIDPNPEHVKNFSNHSQNCTKTGVLNIKREVWGGDSIAFSMTTISCSECKGEVKDSHKIS